MYSCENHRNYIFLIFSPIQFQSSASHLRSLSRRLRFLQQQEQRMRISASIQEAPMTVRLIAVLLVLAGVADAQFESGPSDVSRRVRIRVAFEDHGACDSSMSVVLTGGMGFALAEGS